jgi:hypothetical protein
MLVCRSAYEAYYCDVSVCLRSYPLRHRDERKNGDEWLRHHLPRFPGGPILTDETFSGDMVNMLGGAYEVLESMLIRGMECQGDKDAKPGWVRRLLHARFFMSPFRFLIQSGCQVCFTGPGQ